MAYRARKRLEDEWRMRPGLNHHTVIVFKRHMKKLRTQSRCLNKQKKCMQSANKFWKLRILKRYFHRIRYRMEFQSNLKKNEMRVLHRRYLGRLHSYFVEWQTAQTLNSLHAVQYDLVRFH